jgi:transposase
MIYKITFFADTIDGAGALFEAGAKKITMEKISESTESEVVVPKKYLKSTQKVPKKSSRKESSKKRKLNKYTKEHIEFLKDVAKTMDKNEIVDAFNEKFGMNINKTPLSNLLFLKQIKVKKRCRKESSNPNEAESSKEDNQASESEETENLELSDNKEKSNEDAIEEIKDYIRENKKWDALRLRNEIAQKWGTYWSREKINAIKGKT